MVYALGLSSSEYNSYLQALTRSHSIRTRMYVMDNEHKNLENISEFVLDGQVAINGNALDSSRVLTADLLDQKNVLDFNASNPTTGTLFMGKMVKVLYQVHVPELRSANKWVSVPIFTGPIVNIEKNGSILSIEGHSKEVLAGEIWGTVKVKKNTNKATAIRQLMRKAGEATRHMSLKSTTGKMNEASYAYPKTFWRVARSISSSLNQHMFYNGNGILITRSFPSSTTNSYTFSDGTVPSSTVSPTGYQKQGASLLTDPEVTYDISNLKNAVRVVGKKKGNKPAPYYTAYPPRSHPMHPMNLGRNGQGRYLVEVITDDKYTTKAACKAAAETRLDARVKTAMSVKFDSLPIPHLEPYDWVTVRTDQMTHKFRMDEFTIPLSASGRMTVGYIRRVNAIKRTKTKKRSSVKPVQGKRQGT